jgi:hypothetical protein
VPLASPAAPGVRSAHSEWAEGRRYPSQHAAHLHQDRGRRHDGPAVRWPGVESRPCAGGLRQPRRGGGDPRPGARPCPRCRDRSGAAEAAAGPVRRRSGPGDESLRASEARARDLEGHARDGRGPREPDRRARPRPSPAERVHRSRREPAVGIPGYVPKRGAPRRAPGGRDRRTSPNRSVAPTDRVSRFARRRRSCRRRRAARAGRSGPP